MKKIIITLLLLITTLTCSYAQDFVLSTGISVDEVPQALYGSWRVTAKLEESNSYRSFKPQSIDFWTLSRVGDKITLSNPFSGATADILLQTVEGNVVVFSKRAPYDNKMLTDTITIRLGENTFSGINTLCLDSYSLVDKHLMKSETARYVIEGEKISGDSVLRD